MDVTPWCYIKMSKIGIVLDLRMGWGTFYSAYIGSSNEINFLNLNQTNLKDE